MGLRMGPQHGYYHNNFINNNHFNRVNVAGGNNWVHNPIHRGAVPYNNRAVANRFGGAQNNMISRPTVNQTQQRLNQMGRGAAGFGQGNIGAAEQAFRRKAPQVALCTVFSQAAAETWRHLRSAPGP